MASQVQLENVRKALEGLPELGKERDAYAGLCVAREEFRELWFAERARREQAKSEPKKAE